MVLYTSESPPEMICKASESLSFLTVTTIKENLLIINFRAKENMLAPMGTMKELGRMG